MIIPFGFLKKREVGGIELFPQDNAASLSDINSIGSLSTAVNGATTTVEPTDVYDGNYSIKTVATNTAGSTRISFPVTLGKTYTINVAAKNGTSTTGGINPRSPIAASTVSITGSWAEYNFVIIASATGTATIRFYANLGGSIGDTAYWDKITVIETD